MSNSFKFGRGYHWMVVNMDFATLYPETMRSFSTEEIRMLSGVPSQYQGREERNNHRDRIVLTRRDMSRNREDYPRDMINTNDFSQQSMSREELLRASIVLFMDDDGTTRILKNRYE